MKNNLDIVANSHPLVVCEGPSEEAIIKKLLDAGRLIFPKENLYQLTTTRKAKEIQERYLNFRFEWPVCIVRIADSKQERFKLDSLYRERFPVISFYTHPSIEKLIIIAQGKLDDYDHKYKSCLTPDRYCRQVLQMGNVKSGEFIDNYWDVEKLVNAIRLYKQTTKMAKNEYCLADLLRA